MTVGSQRTLIRVADVVNGNHRLPLWSIDHPMSSTGRPLPNHPLGLSVDLVRRLMATIFS
jgi:hypothetical protein